MDSIRKPTSAQMVCKAVDSLNPENQLMFLKNEYIDLSNYQRNQEFHKNNVIHKLQIINEKQLRKMTKLESRYKAQKQAAARHYEIKVSLNRERQKQIQNAKTFEDTLSTVTAFLTEANMQNALLNQRNRKLTEQIETVHGEHCARKNAVEKKCQNIDIDKEIQDCVPPPLIHFTFDKDAMAENLDLNEPIDEVSRTEKLIEESDFILEKDIEDKAEKAIDISNSIDQFEKMEHLENEVTEWRLHYFNLLEASRATQAQLVEKVRESRIADLKTDVLRKLCKQFQVERESCISALNNVGDDLQKIVSSGGDEEDGVDKWTWNINETTAENIAIELDLQNKQIDEIRKHFAEVYIEVEEQLVRLKSDPDCKEVKVLLFVALLPQMLHKLKEIQGTLKSITVPTKPDDEEDEGTDMEVEYYIQKIVQEMDEVDNSD